MGVPRKRSMKRTRSVRSACGIGRQEACKEHAVQGADAAFATRCRRGRARLVQARLRIGRDVQEGRDARAPFRRGPAAPAWRRSAPSSRTSSAKTSRPPRRMRQRSRKAPVVTVSPMASRPNTVHSTRVRRRIARHLDIEAAPKRAPSNRICSCGSQASRQPGPSARRDGDPRPPPVGAVDLLRRLGREHRRGAGPDVRLDGHPVAARNAAAGVDQHALARVREPHPVAAALGDRQRHRRAAARPKPTRTPPAARTKAGEGSAAGGGTAISMRRGASPRGLAGGGAHGCKVGERRARAERLAASAQRIRWRSSFRPQRCPSLRSVSTRPPRRRLSGRRLGIRQLRQPEDDGLLIGNLVRLREPGLEHRLRLVGRHVVGRDRALGDRLGISS